MGPLLIVGNNNCDLIKAGNNVQGATIVEVKKLTTELLAPGTHPGRLTIWTDDAIKTLNERFG